MSDATPFSTRQRAILITMGAALWFVAAMLIRVIGPMGAFDGGNRLWLYLLVVPGTLPFVFLIRAVAGLATGRVGVGVAVVTATAALIDGVALAWFPWIYADSVELVAAAGAVILWGAGVGMVLGFVVDSRGR